MTDAYITTLTRRDTKKANVTVRIETPVNRPGLSKISTSVEGKPNPSLRTVPLEDSISTFDAHVQLIKSQEALGCTLLNTNDLVSTGRYTLTTLAENSEEFVKLLDVLLAIKTDIPQLASWVQSGKDEKALPGSFILDIDGHTFNVSNVALQLSVSTVFWAGDGTSDNLAAIICSLNTAIPSTIVDGTGNVLNNIAFLKTKAKMADLGEETDAALGSLGVTYKPFDFTRLMPNHTAENSMVGF